LPDLCIKNGTILTLDQDDTVIAGGALCIEGSRITYCGPADGPGMPSTPAKRELDAAGGLILPGLVNAHTHSAMTLMRGVADDLALEQWLEQHIFPMERRLTGQEVYWGTLLACAEMIKNGVTSFIDMYLFAHETARAADQAGMRAVVGEVIYDFPSPSYGELESGFAVTEELIKTYDGHPRISGAVMPHAIYTCSPSLLRRAGELAGDLGAMFKIHLAETAQETAGAVADLGRRPLDHVDSLGLLGPNFLAIHAVDLQPAEIERLAASGAMVTHCPESNMKLASGVMDLDAMLAAGVTVGLGTDGCASNNDLDLFGEMDSCAKLHKVSTLEPTSAPAPAVLAMATRQGGRIMGIDGLGVLAAGAPADVCVVNTNQPHLTPMYNPVSHLVYAASGADVVHTVCHGRVLMADRRLTTIDEAEVMAKAREASARLLGR